jgi:hypothetical protein
MPHHPTGITWSLASEHPRSTHTPPDFRHFRGRREQTILRAGRGHVPSLAMPVGEVATVGQRVGMINAEHPATGR